MQVNFETVVAAAALVINLVGWVVAVRVRQTVLEKEIETLKESLERIEAAIKESEDRVHKRLDVHRERIERLQIKMGAG